MSDLFDLSELSVHVIVDSTANSGRFNMAMDEALLELGAGRDFCVCRIYQWAEPTVSLGYFQASQAEQVSPFPELPTVRRLSGGGAILHDHELTYSCILPASHPVRQDPSQLYGMVHQAVIRLLNSCGCQSRLRSEFLEQFRQETVLQPSEVLMPGSEEFLCFLRQNPNDIVETATGNKIVGSAQRRRRGVILQHGSLLLRASALTPAIPGITELSPGFDEQRFRQDLAGEIAETIGKRVELRGYTTEELAVSQGFLQSRED
ncbi:MAG: biotin/lipoate A/B protein ligase family protein [Planctomycetota bacterium]